MVIRLFSYSVVARGLTYEQVQKAIALANASEAGQHFHFHEHLDDQANDAVKRWALHAMPKIYYESFNGKDTTGWYITIPDYDSPLPASPTSKQL